MKCNISAFPCMLMDNRVIDNHSFQRLSIQIAKIAIHLSTTMHMAMFPCAV